MKTEIKLSNHEVWCKCLKCGNVWDGRWDGLYCPNCGTKSVNPNSIMKTLSEITELAEKAYPNYRENCAIEQAAFIAAYQAAQEEMSKEWVSVKESSFPSESHWNGQYIVNTYKGIYYGCDYACRDNELNRLPTFYQAETEIPFVTHYRFIVLQPPVIKKG